MTDTIALHSAERAADDGVPVADLTEAGLTHTPIQQSMGLARIHGPVYARKFGEHRTLFVSSLDLVTEVADESRFRKGVSVVLENVREFAGDGLFTAYNDEPNWAKAHEVLMPAFALGSMRTYHPAMLKVARRVMASWDRRVADGTPVQVAEDMTRMTLDTIGLAGFGFDFESFSRGDTPHPFVEAMVRCLEWSMTKFSRDPAADHSAADAAFRADADYLASVVDEVIAARTAGGESGDDDLLGLMLGARDQGDAAAADGPTLDLANIRNQVITFLIAGHETTSGALSFALYHLLKDPLALRMVQREADELWGDQADPDPSFEDIGRLPFTRQVLNEALRLWPTAAAFTRQAREDTLLGGRYPVQAGELVTVLTPMLHRDPAWGDNPELFDPSRFSPEAEAARSPHAYKPFGTGERACIGRQFALHEATMLLALLAHRYRLIDHADYRLRIKETLTLKPDGFTLTLAARTPADRAAVRTALAVLPGGGTDTEGGAATDDGLPTRVPQGTGLLVLHGSNYGTCREFAERLADEATGLGFAPDVAPLDAAAGALPADRPVVIVAASYNGRPTDDAAAFVQWLNTAQDGAAAAVPFAVLGVGDRNWAATYQHIPTLIDDRLDALGAHRLLPRAEADASGDLGGTVKEFTAALRTQLLTRYGDPAAVGAARPAAEDTGYTVTEITGGPLDALAARHDLVPMTVTESYDLTAEDWPRPKRFLRIALPDGVGYRTADHLAVLPANAPAAVERAARALGADPETVLALHTAGRAARDTLPVDRPVTVRQLLTHHLELGLRPTPEQVAVLAAHNPCPPERLALETLAEDDPRTLIELIEAHPALRGALPWPTVLELLPPLRIRHYSLSSSPATDARHADLMVSLLPGGTGSTHLHSLRPGDTVLARVQPCREAFRLDPADDTPVILVAAGTGLAPFRGAVADRLAAGQMAPARLYFGCDDPDGDFLHAAEFAAAEAAGAISVRPVFSARPEHGHRFVQHRIAAEAAEVWELLQAGARVYVCGDGSRMAPGVRAAFRELHGAQTGASAQESEAWLRELTASGRYIEDVYAAG
ncbi:cytochrome P450/NADPH-cytochrome P450 reductase [Streptomyces sp. 2333.5]|uniref:cytochrome P450 n=1 Tax=unclassified Streptomyces TaxID=2593676 RepID=UPI00089AC32E|nr:MULTISPECIES: cytochrome P450 [unclassified Streptomyces]PJJ05740.1 cytochrome P450/NADPH-cytochrome P450 reductase [Streptomyces sp. 2333.5]SEE83264.1 cytochrome P450 / NADPH-cytochrome P450 reductase [Streptomyces sp. 2314.4]SEF03287.1 cytochrome P450 / NADPH-cytochrome P450 reductase [Streptomyces sp. 2112.2]